MVRFGVDTRVDGEGGVRVTASARTIAVGTAAVLLALALAALVFYARGGGPVPRVLSFLSPSAGDLLSPSGPEETVLRTLRLAGIERAAVGIERGTAAVRIEAPVVSSAADIEIVWQTGMAALAHAYPRASGYVVQVFADGSGFVEVSAEDGDSVRTAVGVGDGAALREIVAVTLLPEEATADE